jgi:hypothetical protein
VSLNAGENVRIDGSTIAGRDAYSTTVHDNRKRNVRIGLGLGSLAVLAVVGIGTGLHEASGSSGQSVVFESGAPGAAGTLRQLQQAEEQGDAATWCFLASSTSSSTCEGLLSNGFSTGASAQDRDQLSQISIGQPAGGGDTYTFTLGYRGHGYRVQLEWTGQRWELNRLIYLGALNDGGVFTAVIETAEGKGAILGVPVG